MDIWKLDQLHLFIAFAIPGFITIKVFELFFPSQNKDSTTRLIDAITYSCINYAFLLFPIYLVESSDLVNTQPKTYIFFYVFVLLLSPILLAFMWVKLRESKVFLGNIAHPTHKPWDYVFSNSSPYWVVVTLTNGTKLAGKYSSKSFTSSYPAPEQIYLEESWKLNKHGMFKRQHKQTAGILIVTSDISYLELFILE